jgi:5-methylcytosine-specific restriction endonuclease McrA
MRSVPEWQGSTPDADIPPRVRLRVWDKCGGCCAACQRKIAAGEKWQCDHKHALANGGRHAESNLQVLCDWCHKFKTRSDVAVKAWHYKRRLAHAGIKQRKRRPFPGSKESGWKVTFSRGVVRR